MFDGPDEVIRQLRSTGYIADPETATVVYLADSLSKPLLVEGPAGVGKTELAKALSQVLGWELIRLQCYEGLDESRALYEWNYRKQLLRIQAAEQSWEETEKDIFSDEFLLERPLLKAIRSTERTVLLIDEIDRLDLEAEALLLEVLSDWQVSIPELGTVVARSQPWVLLTSNATRELSEALKRRCIFLPLAYPTVEREKEILLERVNGLNESLAGKVAEALRVIRGLDLKKSPSIAESIDWAKTLAVLGKDSVELDEVSSTLGVLLKHDSDLEKARRALETKA